MIWRALFLLREPLQAAGGVCKRRGPSLGKVVPLARSCGQEFAGAKGRGGPHSRPQCCRHRRRRDIWQEVRAVKPV